MKHNILLAVTMVLVASNLFCYRNGSGDNNNNGYMAETYINTLPFEEISEVEKEGLLRIREEEKLARDVYRVLYDRWGLRIFDNISRSEQKHMDAVKTLLIKYGMADPVTDDTTGNFTDPELLKLYEQLIAKGNLSITDALYVGATIEDVDIFDIQNYQLQADNMDILFVFGNLKKGSENHIRAFTGQLSSYNIEYKAQFITQEELEAILSSDSGNGRGRGRG
ncbi:MAG: DUF2202 domain-containing protein [Acidobacteriota bacterium]